MPASLCSYPMDFISTAGVLPGPFGSEATVPRRGTKRCVESESQCTVATEPLTAPKTSKGKPRPKKPCAHGKRRSLCRICSPKRWCVHGTYLRRCKDPACGDGRDFCTHGIRRSRCKNSACGGGKDFCSHGIRRSRCKDTACGGGKELCAHGIQRCYCRDYACGVGKVFCAHGIRRSRCKDAACRGGQEICTHGIRRSRCKDTACGGGQEICSHGIYWHVCKKCNACPHGALKTCCPRCPGGGRNLCPKCPIEAPTKVHRVGSLCAKCAKPLWAGKKRERAVGAKLLEWSAAGFIQTFTSADKSLPGTNLHYRVDFSYDLQSHYTGVECDEHEHSMRGYAPRCELVRIYRLTCALGKPAVWIRYNPDAFKIGVKTARVPRVQRESLLLLVLQAHLQVIPTDFLTIAYICYSQPAVRMHAEIHDYVTTQRFATELEYEQHVGAVYPTDCAAAAGTPWYAAV